MADGSRPELVLVGGGHTHVQVLEAFGAAEAREKRDFTLTVVVDQPVAIYSGMVPGFVAGQYQRHELEIDVRPLAKRADARVMISPVTRIDAEHRRIETVDHGAISFDVASCNIGSTVAGLDTPGVREHALPTRPIAHLVDNVAAILEKARQHRGHAGANEPFHVVIVGAGAGGVELAMTIEYRLRVDVGVEVRVTIVDAGPAILKTFPKSVITNVTRRCEKRGISIRTQTRVESVTEGALHVVEGDDIVPFDALIWVAGPASHDMFRASGIRTDERGFGRVRSTLQLEEHDHVFAAGDCATLIEYPETAKAGVYAVREGPILTTNLQAFLRGQSLQAYEPQRDFLVLLNMGDGSAVGTKWGFAFAGHWVMRLKDRIDRKFMGRFQLSNPTM